MKEPQAKEGPNPDGARSPKAELARRFFLIALVLASGMTGYELGFSIPQSRYVRKLRGIGQGDLYGGDFYPLWWTSRELREHRQNPYCDVTTFELQRHLFGYALDQTRGQGFSAHYRAFSYPLFANLIFWPFAELPFERVRILLAIIFPALSGLTAVLWMRSQRLSLSILVTTGTVLLYVASYPNLEALYALQPTIIVAGLLAATVSALIKGRYWLAGTWLALASIKPQLTVMITPWLLLWSVSRWRLRKGLILSFALITTIMMFGSELLVPRWFGLWVRNVLEYRTYTAPPLLPLLMGRPGEVLGVVMVAATLYWSWTFRRVEQGNDFMLIVSLLLSVTVVVFPAAGAFYEYLLLWPSFVWIYSRRGDFAGTTGPARWILYFSIFLLLWPYVAACGVLGWAALGLSWNAPTMLVPIRIMISLPLISTGLLTLALLRNLRFIPSSPQSFCSDCPE